VGMAKVGGMGKRQGRDPSLRLRMTNDGDDTSRMIRLLAPDELLEAMYTRPSYTLIIEKEEQI